MKKNYFLKLIFLVLLVCAFNTSYGQVDIAAYAGRNDVSEAQGATNTTVTPLSRGSVSSTGTSTFNSSGWNTTSTLANAVTDGDYIEWAITANSGYTVSVSEIIIDYDRSGTGPSQVAIRTSLDGYVSDIFTDASVNSSGEENTFSPTGGTLTSADGGTITFRLYGYDASGSGGTFDIEDDLGTFLTQTNTGIRLRGSVDTASSDPNVTFDSAASSETETDATFSTNIPVTLTNYDADVTISVTVDGSSTAEGGDYTLNTTSLVFDANETLNISLDINDDADSDDETVILNIAVSSGTADLGTSQHTVTITDDDLPEIVITEISYNSNDDNGSDDEWIELYNAGASSVDISSWTLENTSGGFNGTFTFPGSSSIASGAYITLALGSNGDGTFNNDNSFTPDYNNLSVDNDDVDTTNDTNHIVNSSSTFTLKNSGGTTIDTVTYDDEDAGGSSGNSHDGGGLTLEIVDVTLDNSATSSNWQASAFNGGSPGKVSSTTWSGATDNDWDTSGNWSAGVPVTTSDILIPSSLTNYPTASGAVTINTATMNSGSSLIAQSTFSGTVTYNRDLGTTNWYLVGIPVSGETIEDMITNNSFDTGTGSNIGLAPYDNSQAAAADRWDYQTAASTGSLTSGGGYSVKLSTAGTLAFSGFMEVGDVGVSITSGAGNAFNLVGNPYTSYVAANTNADGTNNLLGINSADLTEQTIWLWDQGTSSYDQFNQASAAFHIAPGQGFFVSSTGSNTFDFTEAMQSHQSSDSFQRTSNNRPEINLVMTDGIDTRDADIYYIDGTTTGFDNGFDSSIFGGVGNSFTIFTHAVSNGSGRNLGIQSLPNSDLENMVIPVGIKATSGMEITISAAAFNLPAGINVYLEDKNDGSFTLLDSSSDFVTTLDSDLDGIGRFYLHTRSQALSVDEINAENISIYTSDVNNLRIVGIQNGTAEVSIYNILGKEVVRTSFVGNGLNDVALPNLRTGVYIVQLATEKGTLNKKVIIE